MEVIENKRTSRAVCLPHVAHNALFLFPFYFTVICKNGTGPNCCVSVTAQLFWVPEGESYQQPM